MNRRIAAPHGDGWWGTSGARTPAPHPALVHFRDWPRHADPSVTLSRLEPRGRGRRDAHCSLNMSESHGTPGPGVRRCRRPDDPSTTCAPCATTAGPSRRRRDLHVLSLAIAYSVGESIAQHARAVKSDLAAPPVPATLDDYMCREPRPIPHGAAPRPGRLLSCSPRCDSANVLGAGAF